MSPEENKATVRRAIEEVWKQGQVALVDELYAPTVVYHDPGVTDVHTRDDFKRWSSAVRSTFPDLYLTIEDLIAEGDRVAFRYTFRGTNTGDFVMPMPLPATDKQVTMTGIALGRLAGGTFIEILDLSDSLGLFQQLGLIPAPGQAELSLALGMRS